MNIFVTLAVLFLLKSFKKDQLKNILSAGISLSLAFLTKGFVGLFPLSIFLWYYIIFKEISIKEMFYKSIFLFIFAAIPFILLYFFYPKAIESIYQYFNQQVLRSISQIQTVENRFFIIERFLYDLAPPLIICLIIFYISFKKGVRLSANEKRWMLFFTALGTSGVLPIMISMKQSSFYILTVFPFYSVALSILVAPFIAEIIPKKTTQPYILGGLIIITSIFMSIKQIGVTGRDHELLKDIKLILKVIPMSNSISIDENMSEDYQLIGYFARYGNISLNKKEKLSYHICYKETDIEQGSYIPVKINTKKLKLFRKNE